MPLMQCTKDGKAGWKFGDSGACYNSGNTGEDKRKAVVQGVSYLGSKKVNQLLKHSKASLEMFYDKEGVQMAQAALREELSVGSSQKFVSAIASFLAKSENEVEIDNAGPLADSDAKANDKGDTYGEDGRQDGDGDEADPAAKADLDTPTEKVGSHTVVPPYNKEASPETPPGEETSYEPPTRDDLEPATADKTITEVPESEDIVRKSTQASDDAATAEVIWSSIAYISEEERKKIPDDDFAGSGRSFPIRSQKDVEHAAMLLHHAPNPSAVKRKIIEIARRKGLTLPDSWKRPDEKGKASVYEQAIALFSKLSPEEREVLSQHCDNKTL